MFEGVIRESVVIILLISGVPLVASSVLGLVVSVIQTATQIQEQTITYTVKFAALVASAFLLSEWYSRELVEYSQEILQSMVLIGKMR